MLDEEEIIETLENLAVDKYINERKLEEKDVEAIINIIVLYRQEKEKNKNIDEFCRKELAFERRLKRENRESDEFNQGRFYVAENIRKIMEEE